MSPEADKGLNGPPDDDATDLHDSPRADRLPGEDPDNDVLPISPGRRRIAMWTGILFLVLILGFLLWFVATNTEQTGGGMLGYFFDYGGNG